MDQGNVVNSNRAKPAYIATAGECTLVAKSRRMRVRRTGITRFDPNPLTYRANAMHTMLLSKVKFRLRYSCDRRYATCMKYWSTSKCRGSSKPQRGGKKRWRHMSSPRRPQFPGFRLSRRVRINTNIVRERNKRTSRLMFVFLGALRSDRPLCGVSNYKLQSSRTHM